MESKGVFEELEWRGFVRQCTDVEKLRQALARGKLTCYIGFDPTSDSFHVGSLLPVMALAHMQRHGHRTIVVIGGATGLVGDPSGKMEMRKMLTAEDIERNIAGLRPQFERYLEFAPRKGTLVNNADWGMKLNYIEFLRDIGVHFRVNVMVKADCFRQRLEREEGLSFLEFNYMLLQAYDFLVLAREHNCLLQMGGDDQWSNILAGIDLVRRVEKKEAFGLTFPLIETASGAKMGKTEKGAVWMDAGRTSPYDFYQYWRNTEDGDVARFLKLFTFLPKKDIEARARLKGREINEAKKALAFEVTKLCHGEAAAREAREKTQALFPTRVQSDLSAIFSSADIILPRGIIESGVPVLDLFVQCELAKSKSEARRLIRQAGAYLNDAVIQSENFIVTSADIRGDRIRLRAGKKKYKIVGFQ